jgi:hypothetical protein
MITRINPTTGREEFWNQPPGLPGIWMTRGYCDRCNPYNECLGFLKLSEDEWIEAEQLIAETKDSLKQVELLDTLKREPCTSQIVI